MRLGSARVRMVRRHRRLSKRAAIHYSHNSGAGEIPQQRRSVFAVVDELWVGATLAGRDA